jgi:hypothetical protein
MNYETENGRNGTASQKIETFGALEQLESQRDWKRSLNAGIPGYRMLDT